MINSNGRLKNYIIGEEGKCKRNEHTGEEFRDKGKSKYKKKEILVARKSPSKKLPK